MEKFPSLSAVVVPKTTAPFKRVTLEFASAIPLIVGVELLVTVEEVAKALGAFGAVASIVIERADDSEEVFSAESVVLAVRE